jgi:hypothetical protein
MGGLIVLAWSGVIAYLLWPTGITDQTLANITLGSLLLAGGSVFVVFIALGIAVGRWDRPTHLKVSPMSGHTADVMSHGVQVTDREHQ